MLSEAAREGSVVTKAATLAALSQVLPQSIAGLIFAVVSAGMVGGFARALYEPEADPSPLAWRVKFSRYSVNGVLWAVVALGTYEVASSAWELPPVGGLVAAYVAAFGQVEVARGVLRILDRLPFIATKKLGVDDAELGRRNSGDDGSAKD